MTLTLNVDLISLTFPRPIAAAINLLLELTIVVFIKLAKIMTLPTSVIKPKSTSPNALRAKRVVKSPQISVINSRIYNIIVLYAIALLVFSIIIFFCFPRKRPTNVTEVSRGNNFMPRLGQCYRIFRRGGLFGCRFRQRWH